MAKIVMFAEETNASFVSSYNRLGVHEKMLKDGIRTSSYLEAFERNPDLVRGKTVLDVGCGTGILSLFAARAGASHVYAVDVSNMIEAAKAIARANGFENRITFIKGWVEEVELPQVDIVVSEWQGFCLLSEFNLNSVLFARDRALKPGGIVLPDINTLHIAGIQDSTNRNSKIDYWDDVYGFDFGTLKPSALSTGYLATPGPHTVVTSTADVLRIDMQSIHGIDETLHTPIPFVLQAKRGTTVDAFIAWFDYQFTKGKELVSVSTGPHAVPTHWKQTVLFIEHPIQLQKGEELRGNITFQQAGRDLIVLFDYTIDGVGGQVSKPYRV